jgi:predicted double-glycine peptidase
VRKKAENESRLNELMNIEKQKEINSELIAARAQKDNASRLNDFMNAQNQREIPTEQFSSCQSNNNWPKQASFKF